jgi:hypothetical protein
MTAATVLLYLDQNYLSGMVKRKPAFRELEPVLRAAVAARVVTVPASELHRQESAPRPDLGITALLAELSQGAMLREDERGGRERWLERRLAGLRLSRFPERRARASDRADLRALALALPRCRLITCDAFMAELVRRAGYDVRFQAELYSGRRGDVGALRVRLEGLLAGRSLSPA